MLRKEILGFINPLNLGNQEQAIFNAFLQENIELKLLRKFKSYAVLLKDKETDEDVIYEFQLKNEILVRHRKENREGLRYEIIDNDLKLGKGGYGVILRSMGVLVPTPTQLFFKPKSRAVKKQTNPDAIDAEYKHAKLLPHLHIKPPTKIAAPSLNEVTSYMAMRHMPGENLYKIIKRQSKGKLSFSVDQRIALTLRILHAIQQQSHHFGLIHRDIKPENIMVDLETDEVNIIDYAFSKDMHNALDNPAPQGTIIMMPPEQFRDFPKHLTPYSLKSDSYAIGKTLAELWHADAEVNQVTMSKNYHLQYWNYSIYAQKDTTFSYSNLLNDDLNLPHTRQIQNMLEQLTRALPEDRLSLDNAIHTLEKIQMERAGTECKKSRLGF